MHRTNTNSNEGKFVCTEKKPTEPKITIDIIIFKAGNDFLSIEFC